MKVSSHSPERGLLLLPKTQRRSKAMAEDCWGRDFLEWIGPDISACVFSCLDHPADLVRSAAVSQSWRRFVIDGGFSRSLCLRLCPEVAAFAAAAEVTKSRPPSPTAPESTRERDHRIYSHLGGALTSANPSAMEGCSILHCVAASSTDKHANQIANNTLNNFPNSFWSSLGQDDPRVPESLTYRLNSDISLIDEILVHPFEAYYQHANPIYSSKTVRFRVGHPKLSRGLEPFVMRSDQNNMGIHDDNYTWIYTSPEFPMLQENVLQSFKLPRPVLCIGGIVMIELLGRVQKQASDGKYYICVCHAQVQGRSLSPVLMVDIDPEGHPILKYLPGAKNLCLDDMMQNDSEDYGEWRSLVARYRQMRCRRVMIPRIGWMQIQADGAR